MNDNTLVAICGYWGNTRDNPGDHAQINNAMPYLKHHRCPVVVLSPTDAAITAKHVKDQVGVEFKQGGVRCYIGQPSLDRQKEHLKILLQYPHEYFLVNDADSICLSPKIPDYLYAEKDVLWSNEVSDAMHIRPADYTLPRLAFQPPYFMSRSVIERLIVAADQTPTCAQTPFIDWCMMAWAITGGIAHKGFPDGASCGTGHMEGYNLMSTLIRRHGRIFIHSIKTLDILRQMAYQRIHFKKYQGKQ